MHSSLEVVSKRYRIYYSPISFRSMVDLGPLHTSSRPLPIYVDFVISLPIHPSIQGVFSLFLLVWRYSACEEKKKYELAILFGRLLPFECLRTFLLRHFAFSQYLLRTNIYIYVTQNRLITLPDAFKWPQNVFLTNLGPLFVSFFKPQSPHLHLSLFLAV